MFTIKKATAVAAAALAVSGAVAAAAPASADVRAVSQNVRFFNENTGGSLDANGLGGNVALSWTPNGTAYQDWFLDAGSQGGVQIRSRARNQCLQAPENAGDQIAVVDCNKYIPTQWWVLNEVNGRYAIALQRDQERVIESVPTGNPVFLGFFDGNENQVWDVNPS
ncbi:RICIN domain-containing protein [Kitasatospora sp. NPDC094011]|uniref:RICIN domain-containing protein n=1 Tax=Kitasatospora sp. NPDC094011 TaxID=3364090 RepID=UPI0037FD3E60